MDNQKASYHQDKTAAYVLPNDAPEHVRLEEQSNGLIAMQGNKPFHIPSLESKTARRIIDIGCGTGAMTVRLAHENPDAEVFGVDLSPVPPVHAKPENVKFIIGNVCELVDSGSHEDLKPGSFDVVYSRLVEFGMDDWPRYLNAIRTLLAPGGWVELQEVELQFRNRESEIISGSWEWLQEMQRGTSARSLDILCGAKLSTWLREMGFVSVNELMFRWLFGPEPDEEFPNSDRIRIFSITSMAKNISRMLAGILGLEMEDEKLERLGQEFVQTSAAHKGSYTPFFAVWGQKPKVGH